VTPFPPRQTGSTLAISRARTRQPNRPDGWLQRPAEGRCAAVCRRLGPLLPCPPCDGAGTDICACNDPEAGVSIRPRRRHALAVLLCGLTALPFAGPAAPSPAVKSKEAEAQQVLAQIQQIDADLDHAVDSYNAAQIELDQIAAAQRLNAARLRVARSNLGAAQSNLESRLVDLYTSGEDDLIEVLLGSSSFDELIDRLDTADRVSSQDAKIVGEVRTFRAEVKQREAQLAQARDRQEEVVAEREARKAAVEAKLAERQRLLSSIKDQIAKLKAEEAASQRRLEAQARARISSSSVATPTGNAPPSQYGGVVGIAMQYLGTPYVWGGASPAGFDCSGFVMYVYSQVGVSLPHNAAMQYGYGSPVDQSQLQAGDLVFFNGLGHVGIYIGGNQFIHSPHTGDVVKISTITGWYSSTWVGARRL
jgi:peptidoglycan DL-endopeptidase CwlO